MAAETEKVTGEFARFVHGARTEDARFSGAWTWWWSWSTVVTMPG